MYPGSQLGRVEVITGVMFAGKTEELIRRVRRSIIARTPTQVFKSHLDDRYGLFRVTTHDGAALEATPVDSAGEISRAILPETRVVAVDEVQLLDEGIVEVVEYLAGSGRRVILAGTETDFRGEPFGPMPALLTKAEVVDKLHAICVECGAPACRNQRLVDGRPAPYDAPTVSIGGRESYEARCRHCHVVPKGAAAQTSLL